MRKNDVLKCCFFACRVVTTKDVVMKKEDVMMMMMSLATLFSVDKNKNRTTLDLLTLVGHELSYFGDENF